MGFYSNVKLGGFESNAERLLKIENLLVSACGTSLFAGMFGVGLMRRLKAFHTCMVYIVSCFHSYSGCGCRRIKRGYFPAIVCWTSCAFPKRRDKGCPSSCFRGDYQRNPRSFHHQRGRVSHCTDHQLWYLLQRRS